MSLIINNVRTIDTRGLDDFLLQYWRVRTEQTWQNILQKSSFCMHILENNKLVGFGWVVDDSFYKKFGFEEVANGMLFSQKSNIEDIFYK